MLFNKSTFIIFILLFFSLFILNAETFPDFSREHWIDQYDSARGKMFRGIGLGISGLGSTGLTAFFIVKAAEDPERYLAYSLVSGIATLGMTGHGFFSIAAGIREMRKAEYFTAQYDTDSVNQDEEKEYYLYLRRKTAFKMIFFGSVITLQSAILFSNGIILSSRKNNGEDLGDIKIWPNYAIGGALLAGGTFLIVNNIRRLRGLRELGTFESEDRAVFIQPIFGIDQCGEDISFGFSGSILY